MYFVKTKDNPYGDGGCEAQGLHTYCCDYLSTNKDAFFDAPRWVTVETANTFGDIECGGEHHAGRRFCSPSDFNMRAHWQAVNTGRGSHWQERAVGGSNCVVIDKRARGQEGKRAHANKALPPSCLDDVATLPRSSLTPGAPDVIV
ncbi:hypothetical protein C2857_005682 [Epichloe festucae Fl1]|uniref:Uncharacterized protein n=1 Tax=Epichloe festucae (strain Fl1) TaxID=877507 RepID=A0A7S9KL46_EPIFF|nr:hypothetical protein C2857_005682 [Epichloe festucae Fl1]